ncbi:MAG: glycosyltransferase [Acidobacteriota bacterium]
MDRFRIAIASDWFAPRVGGIELHLRDLARELRARGHDVVVFTTVPGPSMVDGIPVHRMIVPMWPRLGVAQPNLLRIPLVVRILRGLQPDLVHAHGTFSVAAIGMLIAGRYLGVPTITTHHSLLRGKAIGGARAVYRVFSYRADLVSAVSQAAAIDAREVSGREEVAILPNGIRPEAWYATRVEPDDCHLVSVMRLTWTKSPQTIVRALPTIVSRLSGAARVRLTIAGDGPDRASLEALACHLGVADRVTFLGEVSRERLAVLFNGATAFVHTGEMEAFGLSVLEARCAGLPIVAMNHGATPEIVEHQRSGLLANTTDELVDHVVRVASEPSLRRALGLAAREGVEQYAWDPVIARHVEVYRDTIQRFRRRRGLRRLV